MTAVLAVILVVNFSDALCMQMISLKGLQSMFNLCDAYAKTHFLIFNAEKNVPYVSR